MSLIYASMAEGGAPSVTVRTGVGTVFDPRVGRGTPLTPGLATQWVAVAEGGDALTYSLPGITCAVLNAAAADPSGKVEHEHDLPNPNLETPTLTLTLTLTLTPALTLARSTSEA